MKRTLCVLALVTFVLVFSSNSFACTQDAAGCVTSFTLAPSEIHGDNLDPAIATITATIHSGHTGHILELILPGNMSIGYVCAGTTKLGPNSQGTGYAGGCSDPNATGSITYTVLFSGYNATGTPLTGQITADTAYSVNADSGITDSITVDPIQTPGPSVDMNCCDGNKSCGGCAGHPINVTNGNTFINQRDYSIPGLAGGLTLSRTWNSLWSLLSPPEQSGIFGDSWRSTFEERIQSLGSIANYWKESGSRNVYQCVGTGCSWQLIAPANDQTLLSYNSNTSQWTITEKNGTIRTFNSAGYLISIADLNGNTISINVDAANQNRIASVTDAAGRVLTFNYADPAFPRLCSSISDSVGPFTTYHYVSGKLTQVLYPDGSQYNFAYNDSNSPTLISEVTDSLWKRIEFHTYDAQRRGVTSQLANDSAGQAVQHIHVYYQQFAPYQNLVDFNEGANGSANISISSVAQRNYVAAATGSLYACATCGWQNGATQLVNRSGYPLATTDANGNTTYFTYDTQGNVLTRGLPRPEIRSSITRVGIPGPTPTILSARWSPRATLWPPLLSTHCTRPPTTTTPTATCSV
jgi:YD repeat-containing protein